MSARVMIWVQHLLGMGHLARARIVAEALGGAGFEAVLVSGGFTPEAQSAKTYRLVQLPPARAKDENFDELVDEHGMLVDDAWRMRRRDLLIAAFRDFRPDLLITETYPFGRRLLSLELEALVEDAARMRCKIAASVRDVLQRPRKDGRAAEMIAAAQKFYDAVIVHSDRQFLPLTASFPECAQISDRCLYTGYICAPVPGAPAEERHEILVSAGGGAAGASLIETAIEARMLSRLTKRKWTFVTGPLARAMPRTDQDIVQSLPDFRTRMACAAVSVSQAGYNTIAEAVSARTPIVAVPFETERETEQMQRARAFAARGLVLELPASAATPEALASAIDRLAGTVPPPSMIDFQGRAGTVRAVKAVLAS